MTTVRSRTAKRPSVGTLSAAPLILGSCLYFVAAIRGISVPGQTVAFYLENAVILLAPVAVFAAPLCLLITRVLSRFAWFVTLICAGSLLVLSWTAGPAIDLVLYGYVVLLALSVLTGSLNGAALEPSEAE